MTNDKQKNAELQMTNQKPSTERVFDLSDRTEVFAKDVIDLVRTIKRDVINNPLISQIIRSSTSVGANYMEADCAQSKKDFIHKISLCKKEAKETIYWLRIIAYVNKGVVEACKRLEQESYELVRIFSGIIKSSRANDKK